jgi:ankyrin repeat protein
MPFPDIFFNSNKTQQKMDDDLLAAIKADRFDHAQRIVNRGATDLTATNKFGSTYLHYAVYYSGTNIIHLLIQEESSILDTVDGALISPLHIACEKGRSEIVEILMQAGSKAASFVDKYEYRPRDCATRFGHTAVINVLDRYKTVSKGSLQDP